jgi:hypothetical protein
MRTSTTYAGIQGIRRGAFGARPAIRLPFVLSLLVVISLVCSSCSSGGGSGVASLVSVTPVHGGATSTFKSGELVNITVGPNKIFTPHLKVNIIECSDPGGTKSHLPTSFDSCDGNTIQGGTILIEGNGSFSELDYPIYSLPNRLLGEDPTLHPVCNRTHKCVLYVGEDQNNFTYPKLFSAPFIVDPTPTR